MNRKTIGRVFILLGISMWIPYAMLKFSDADVTAMPFLALHLAGVIPGAILARGETMARTIARWRRGNDDQSSA